MKQYILLISSLFLAVLTSAQNSPKGLWRASLSTEGGPTINFTMEVDFTNKNAPKLIVQNASERILIREIALSGDSLAFKMPYFDNDFKVVMKPNRWEGKWIKHLATRDVEMIFKAIPNNTRYDVPQPPKANITGRWACTFTDEKELIVGEFTQKESKIIGTFLTPTGDYRYLEGVMSNKNFTISTFDGSHAYVFTGVVEGDSIKNGVFYSGLNYSTTWNAKKNEKATILNGDTVTKIVAENVPINFSFRNTKGELVSLSDPQFEGKVIVLQIMGSWCPNCLDESKFLAPYYTSNKSKGVEIIGLSFERTNDFEKEKVKIDRFVQQIGITYPVLFAGSNNKAEAVKAVPFLSSIYSFPTTIFLDKNKIIRKVHAGFSGPGTGVHYAEYVKEFEADIQKLLKQ